jgi:hypothetical protein
VLRFQVSLPEVRYDTDEKRIAFWDRVTERIATTPGVDAAGVVSCPPLKPGEKNPVTLYRPARADPLLALRVE